MFYILLTFVHNTMGEIHNDRLTLALLESFETGKSRFRPIILTSLTTIAGLAPLIFEKELQAQFLIPMAIAIAYGLILATLLTLIFLPAFLKIINKIRYTKEWIFTGNKLNNEEREPAIKEIHYENM